MLAIAFELWHYWPLNTEQMCDVKHCLIKESRTGQIHSQMMMNCSRLNCKECTNVSKCKRERERDMRYTCQEQEQETNLKLCWDESVQELMRLSSYREDLTFGQCVIDFSYRSDISSLSLRVHLHSTSY